MSHHEKIDLNLMELHFHVRWILMDSLKFMKEHLVRVYFLPKKKASGNIERKKLLHKKYVESMDF